jgi:2',3'-cyclic-nucleotide 2'-phosphodiesterase (5'-nucleotidase family)
MKKFYTIGILAFVISCKPIQYTKTYVAFLDTLGTDIKEDTSIVNFIKPYKEKVDADMKRIIGYNKVALEKTDGESTLGNFVADAILSKAQELRGSHIQMAAVNNGGLRSPIYEGVVTVENVYELMPFENEMVVLTLSGLQTRDYLQYQGQKRIHIAGVKSTFTKAGGIKLKTALINNTPLDTNKTYIITMSDYMAKTDPEWIVDVPREYLNVKLRDLLIEYYEKLTAKKDSVRTQIDGRMVFE